MTRALTDLLAGRDEVLGADGGFLGLRRLHLRNQRDDGSVSRAYICDFIVRRVGCDAVVVLVYRRRDGAVEVLLRRGLRPALSFGRRGADLPIDEPHRPHLFVEVVAGVLEVGDRGEAGIRRRAAIEVAEEAGFAVDAAAVEFLGAGTFPSPGAMPEKFWLTAVELSPDARQGPLAGDGSPMEEGASTFWLRLEDAIGKFVSGELEDMKSELVLRRLLDRLRDAP